jgi:hypothetical protein
VLAVQETTNTNTQPKSDAGREAEGRILPIIISHAAFEFFPGHMNATQVNDRQLVFVVYRELFSGRNAAVRKANAIRKIILIHAPVLQVSAVDTHLDKTISTLQSLLRDRVFESDEQASKFFPELFRVQPLALPTTSMSKKRKGSSGGPTKRGPALQIGSTDEMRPGTTASMCSLVFLFKMQYLTIVACRSVCSRQSTR